MNKKLLIGIIAGVVAIGAVVGGMFLFKHEHTEAVDGAIAPTCLETGLTEGKHCSVCNEIIVEQETVAVLGHNMVTDSAVAPTCEATGLTEGSHCSRCDYVVAQEVVGALGHDMVTDSAVSPTCEATGLTEGKHCSVCDKVIIAQVEIAIIDHIEGDWITDRVATKTDEGKQHTECIMCKKSMNEKTIDAIGSINLEYKVNADGTTCTITGLGTCTDTEIYIPSAIDGYTVTNIGNKAFSENSAITFIKIPNTVLAIGIRAFYKCTGITEITIPASVTDIGTQIFFGCDNLATVYYNSIYGNENNPFLEVDSIETVVFGGRYVPDYVATSIDNIKTVIILEGVTGISYGAFSCCYGLTSVTIPSSVIKMGDLAFNCCSSLESVYINDLLSWCNISASRNAAKPNGNLYLNGELVTELILPEGITCIGDYAFYGCDSIKTVVVPNSVKQIGKSAFEECRNLTDVVLPEGLTKINDYTFKSCFNLISITIPNSVTSIGISAFSSCRSLTSITIPDNVSVIDNYAFSGSGITTLMLPSNMSSVYAFTFSNCTNLTSLVIPDNVSVIGDYAFRGCRNLVSVTIPDSVTRIGENAFYECPVVEVINFSELDVNRHFGSFLLEVHQGDSKITSYGDYLFYVGDDVNYLLSYSGNQSEIILPESFNDESYVINKEAFRNRDDITGVVIPDGVTAIGYGAFADCGSLTNVTIGKGVVEIGTYAFLECNALKEIFIPSNVTHIRSYAFMTCTNLSIFCEVEGKPFSWVSDWNKSKCPVAWGCTSFGTTDDGFMWYNTSSGISIFGYSGTSSNVIIPQTINGISVVAIADKAFRYKSLITSVVIPDGVKSIGDYAFNECKNLNSIVIPSSVTTVGEQAFYNSMYESKLRNVYYTGSEEDWKKVKKGAYNYSLTGATIHYNYIFEE